MFKLLKSEIWIDGRILALFVYMFRKFFIKREPFVALQLHVFVLPKPSVGLHEINFTHVCLVIAFNFIEFCDPSEMSFILA